MAVNNGRSWKGNQEGSRNEQLRYDVRIVPCDERMEKELAKQYKITAVVVRKKGEKEMGIDGKGEGKEEK